MNFDRYRGVIVGRIIISAMTYILTFGMAAVIGAAEYGVIAFYIFLAKNVPLFSLGLTQGLIYNEVSGRGDMLRSYAIAYSGVCAVILLVYGLFYDISLALISLPLCFIHILEPYLKTKRDFLAILYVELFCCVAFFSAWVTFDKIGGFWPLMALLVMSLALVILFSSSRIYLIKKFFDSFRRQRFRFSNVGYLVKRGGASYLFNLSYFLFLLIDRSFVNEFHPADQLGAIMLAFQLAVASGFIPVAMNSRAVVDYGEEIENGDGLKPILVWRRLRLMLLINFCFLFLVLAGYYFIGCLFFDGYEGVVEYVLIFGLSMVLFNGYGAISPILFYLKRQVVPVIALSVSLMFMFVFNVYSLGNAIPLIIVELINFSALSLSIVFCLFYVFYVSSRAYSSGYS